jgi:hypothetical protein
LDAAEFDVLTSKQRVAFLVLLNRSIFCPNFGTHTLDVTGQTFLTPDLLNTSQGRLDVTRAGVVAQLNDQVLMPALLSLAWWPIESTIQADIGGCNKLKERCL